MLTVSFKLVWNTQKSTWTNSFEYQDKILLNIEKVLAMTGDEQPQYHFFTVFHSYFRNKGVNFSSNYNLRNLTKQNLH